MEYEIILRPLIKAYETQDEEAIATSRATLMNWLSDSKVKQTSFLDLQNFPQFICDDNAGKSFLRTLVDLGILVFVNVLFFGLSFVAFIRYDVRSN